MPFFLRSCIKMRKKKKAVKKNSSTYFKSYLDKESPVTSEAIHEGPSNSFTSIDRDEKELGLPPKLILGSSGSETENAEIKQSGNTEDITRAPSPDRDIFDILSSAVHQLSEEKSSSDDNRYSILSSSSILYGETDNIERKELLNQSFETSDNKLNDAKEQNFPDGFTEVCVEDEPETQNFIIANRLSKEMLLTDIYRSEHESTAEIIKMPPVEEYSVDVVKFVSTHNKVSEIESLLPLTIMEYSVERTVPSASKESAEIGECKYEDETCFEVENVSTTDSRKYSDSSSEKYHCESESTLRVKEISPIIDILDQKEENYETEGYQFFDSELSSAVKNALCISLCESEHENKTEGFTDNAIIPFDSGHLEITGASTQRKEEKIINQADSINLSFGDNIPEILKLEDKTEYVPFNDTLLNETHDTSNQTQEMRSPLLPECSGDHPANIAYTYEKGLTCRMAAKLTSDLSSNFPKIQMCSDPKLKSNTKQHNAVNKHRRSRNALLSSLKIKVSPKDVQKEINNTNQHGVKISEQKCKSTSNERNIPYDVNVLQILEQNNEKTEREETVCHTFIYGIEPFKTMEGYVGDCSTAPLESPIDYTENINDSSVIETTGKNTRLNKRFEDSEDKTRSDNYASNEIKQRNDYSLTEKVSDPLEITEKMKVQVHEVIKKILSFVQREVSLLHQNKEYEPKSFSYFIKELLFDYKFFQDKKNEKLLQNQMPTDDSERNTFESNETKILVEEYEGLCTCEYKYTEIEINENFRLSPHKYNISYEDIKPFYIGNETKKCESKTFSTDFENFRGVGIIEKAEEYSTLMTSDIKTDHEECLGELKLSQSLDEYLALSELLKYKNKTHKSKNTLTPTSSDIGSKNLPDKFDSKTLYNTNENIICFQMTDNNPTVVESWNKLESFSFDNINFIDEAYKDTILESPSLHSEGGDIGKNDLCMEAFTSCGDTCIKLDLGEDNFKSETVLTSDSTTKEQRSELYADKCTLSGQDPRSHVTIVLSPRENNATVNCSVNMTISGNTPTCTPRVTSPISIQVTREDTREKETCSLRTRNIGLKTSAEEFFRRDRIHHFDVKKVERERLKNIELYDINKREAMKSMNKQTRIIPINPSESFEFTLSNLDNSVKAKKRPQKRSVKSTKHDTDKLLTSHKIKRKGYKSVRGDVQSYSSSITRSVQETDMEQDRIPNNYTFQGTYDLPNSLDYGTPMRRRILATSKAIRSPKYSLKSEPLPMNEVRRHKATPHKIIVNNSKLYFLDESSPVYKREQRGRSRVLGNISHFEDRHRPLSSPFSDYRKHLLCTKLSSPKDLNSKFDDKFKRYARRGRNTGDLISYKRSTQWLRDAGIVGQALTAKEADTVFKCAAGVKVALNKFDYRRFLYKLARLKRLRYSEIYESLCEAVNELA